VQSDFFGDMSEFCAKETKLNKALYEFPADKEHKLDMALYEFPADKEHKLNMELYGLSYRQRTQAQQGAL
jgi:hypothetical protein